MHGSKVEIFGRKKGFVNVLINHYTRFSKLFGARNTITMRGRRCSQKRILIDFPKNNRHR